jgi:hypothetical protein
MLFIPSTPSSATESKTLSGRELLRLRNHLPPRRLALVAGDLIVGRRYLIKPTTAQAAWLAGISCASACAGKAVVFGQPHLRSAVEYGQISLVEAANRTRVLTDAAVDRIVAKLGAERVLAALDRITRPTAAAAE